MASLCYGVFGGIRGWVFSIINSNLLKRLRCDLSRPADILPRYLYIPHRYRQAVFNHVVEQDMGFFEKEEVGVITSRLGADCQVIARLFSTNINVALRNAVQFIGTCFEALYTPFTATLLSCTIMHHRLQP